MIKKILILFVEIALIALVCYGIVTLLNSISFAEWQETAPWCVVEYTQGR